LPFALARENDKNKKEVVAKEFLQDEKQQLLLKKC